MPDVASLEVESWLRDYSIKYQNESYLSEKIAPVMDGVTHKAKILTYDVGDTFRNEATVRAPGTKGARGSYGTSSVSIAPVQYNFGYAVTREDVRAQGDFNAPPVELKIEAVEYATDKVKLAKEIRTADLIKATTWADGNSGGEDAAGLWAPSSSNTFLNDIRTGKAAIQSKRGVNPANCSLTLDYKTFELLREEDTIADKIKYVGMDILTEQLLARLLGLKNVYVWNTIVNSAKEGQTASMANILETNSGKGGAFLFYEPARMGLKTQAALGQFRIKQDNGSGMLVEEYYEDAEKQWVYECTEEVDEVVIDAQLGYHWKDTALT